MADVVPSKLRARARRPRGHKKLQIMNKTLPHVLTAKLSVPQGLEWMGSSNPEGRSKLYHHPEHSQDKSAMICDAAQASQFPITRHMTGHDVIRLLRYSRRLLAGRKEIFHQPADGRISRADNFQLVSSQHTCELHVLLKTAIQIQWMCTDCSGFALRLVRRRNAGV